MARITVEDCLRRENNRFALVLLASQRAKQLLSGADPLTDTEGNKHIVAALREIAASKVRFMTPEEAIIEEEKERVRAQEQEDMRSEASALPNGSSIISQPLPIIPNGNGSQGSGSDDAT